jgi:hypothetical protein
MRAFNRDALSIFYTLMNVMLYSATSSSLDNISSLLVLGSILIGVAALACILLVLITMHIRRRDYFQEDSEE